MTKALPSHLQDSIFLYEWPKLNLADSSPLYFLSFGYGEPQFQDIKGRPVTEGNGCVYFTDGQILYKGSFKDNKWNGKGEAYFQNGELQYVGNYENDKWHGQGKVYYDSGCICYDGNLGHGKFEGAGKYYNPNGILNYEGSSKDDMRHGSGTLYYKDGKTAEYEGKWKNDKPEGKFCQKIGGKIG
jgi:hypothetical protein